MLRAAIRLADPVAIRLAAPAMNSLGDPTAIHYPGPSQLRWRLLGGKLYAMGTAGTLMFPEGVGTLRPGAFASLGLGVDNAR
ncbi:hypothetical protein D7Y23_38920 [Corallococcus sp. AB050B]|nr:hypothetical protein D7Y23_38920 [Corallococcus sp. AB050B]